MFSELQLAHRDPYKRAPAPAPAPAQLLGHSGDSIDLFLFHEKAAVPRNPFPSPRISRSYLHIYLHIYLYILYLPISRFVNLGVSQQQQQQTPNIFFDLPTFAAATGAHCSLQHSLTLTTPLTLTLHPP